MRQHIIPLVQFAAAVALVVFFVVCVAEWLAGCGEHYIDSKGNTYQNECLFITR